MRERPGFRALVLGASLLLATGGLQVATAADPTYLTQGARATTAQAGGDYLHIPTSRAAEEATGFVRVDPARGPSRAGMPAGTSLKAREYVNLNGGIAALKAAADANALDPLKGKRRILFQSDWDALPQAQRDILTSFGITFNNALNATFMPYFHYDTVTPNVNAVPKRIAALDFDHYNEGQITYKNETRTRTVTRQDWEVTYEPVCGGCVNGVSTWAGIRGGATPPPFGEGCCTMVESGRQLKWYTDVEQYNVNVPDTIKAAADVIAVTKTAEPFQDVVKTRTVLDWEITYEPVCGGCVNGVSTWAGRRGAAVPPPFGEGCCTMVESGRRQKAYTETYIERLYNDRLVTIVPDKDEDGNSQRYTLANPDADGNAVFQFAYDANPNDGVNPPIITATLDQIKQGYTLSNIDPTNHRDDTAERAGATH